MLDGGLIVGASGGIGTAIHNVMEHGRVGGISWLAPTMQELDIRWPQDILLYLKRSGPFKYIVYSAGVNVLGWVGQLGSPGTALGALWETNCAGFVHLMGCHERLYPEAKGSAVAISSDAARRPMRGSLAYCASKAALDMSVRCMARELAPRWRVNAVSPGMTAGTKMTARLDVDIPRFRGWSPDYARKYEESQTPMGRRAHPAEIAQVVLDVLVGPEYLTGSIIEINGGR